LWVETLISPKFCPTPNTSAIATESNGGLTARKTGRLTAKIPWSHHGVWTYSSAMQTKTGNTKNSEAQHVVSGFCFETLLLGFRTKNEAFDAITKHGRKNSPNPTQTFDVRHLFDLHS